MEDKTEVQKLKQERAKLVLQRQSGMTWIEFWKRAKKLKGSCVYKLGR